MKRIISDELQAALRCLVIAWRLFTEEPLHEDTTDYDSQKWDFVKNQRMRIQTFFSALFGNQSKETISPSK